MARRQGEDIVVPTSVAAGAGSQVTEYGERITVFLTGTFVATVQFQISADDTTYFDEGSALTAPGVVEITKPCKFVRANVTAYTSGTPLAEVVGVVSTG